MQADVERAGVMPARADTIRSLARAVARGGIVLDARADVSATVAALLAIPGIGTWTAEYVAMRALGEPDAFPSGDLVLRRMAGDLSARALDRRADAWRPWRSVRGHAALGSGNSRAADQLSELSFPARCRPAGR